MIVYYHILAQPCECGLKTTTKANGECQSLTPVIIKPLNRLTSDVLDTFHERWGTRPRCGVWPTASCHATIVCSIYLVRGIDKYQTDWHCSDCV